VSEDTVGGAQAGGDPGAEADEPDEKSPLRRTLDLCLFAPVGVAMTVVEDLPELISKGRQRVELGLGNARVVGQFVVDRSQRKVSGRLEDLLSSMEQERRAPAEGDAAPPPAPPAEPPPPPKPAPDPAAAAIVGGALADYDTLSASQVVRRLPSLGPDELRAVHRYEASHRNRRTILNRASQLLDGGPAASPHG
jgi:hypothetical protein